MDIEGFENDPYGSITAEMIGERESDVVSDIAVQTIFEPAPGDWWKGGLLGTSIDDVADELKSPTKEFGMVDALKYEAKPEQSTLEGETREASEKDRTASKIVREQRGEKGFRLNVRILAVSDDPDQATARVEETAQMFDGYYESATEQGFEICPQWDKKLRKTLNRAFGRERADRRMIMGVRAAAGLMHIPNDTINTQDVDWSLTSHAGDVPADAPRFTDWNHLKVVTWEDADRSHGAGDDWDYAIASTWTPPDEREPEALKEFDVEGDPRLGAGRTGRPTERGRRHRGRSMSLNPFSENQSEAESEKFGVRIEGEDDPSKPVLINSKEWQINRYDPVSEEVEAFAGAWPRAMIENAQAEPKQPLWIGVSESTGREVPIEFDRLFRHVFYGGSTGTGKTTKMYNDAVALMYAGHGITVIDPKGDDIYDLLRRVPRDRWDDVIYIAPGDDYMDRTVGFNLFETFHEPDESGFDEEIEGIVDDFKNLIVGGEYWGPRMDRIMKTMVRGMVRHPRDFTPIEMYYTLLEDENRAEYAGLIGDQIEDDDIMFLEGFTRRIADELSDSDLDPLIGRLKDWVENPMTRQIIAQRESNVSIAEAVNEGKIVIVKNDLPSEAQTMVATAVMRRVWTCVTDRVPESERKVRELAGLDDTGAEYDPYFLMIDECDDVLTEASQIDTMLTKARSKRLSLMLATQTLHQLDESAQQAILSNCNTLVSLNPLLPAEASALAKRFGGKDPDDLTQIPDYHAQTKLRHEEESFMAKLTPPYPPLYTIQEAFELIRQSIDDYGVERQSGREIMDEMFFADTGQSACAKSVGLENTESPDMDETMDVDDTKTARTAVKAVYDATIRAGEDMTAIDSTEARDLIREATGLGPRPASNMTERLAAVGAIEQRSTSDGLELTVTPEGREIIGLQTGSGGSGGVDAHRFMLRRVYEWGTRLGYDMDLPTQDGDELPDAVGEIPPNVYPPDGFGDLTDDERDQLLRGRLEGEYEEILELSGTGTFYIEVESKGITKPAGPIKNAAKAPGPEQLLFVVEDGGGKGLTSKAETLAGIFGIGPDANPYVSGRAPEGVSRKFYTRNRVTMNPDLLDHEPDKFAVVRGDVSTEWVEYPNGKIACRERGDGETFLTFDGADEYRERDLEDAPAIVYYHADREGYAVEVGGEIERVYGSKAKLTEDWSWIYEPLIPEVMFIDYGYEAVPEPEAFRIGIVPHDDRDLDADLLMYDHATGEVSDDYATAADASRTESAAPVSDGSESPEDRDSSESGEECALAEARVVAGKEEPAQSDKGGGGDPTVVRTGECQGEGGDVDFEKYSDDNDTDDGDSGMGSGYNLY
ncbi:type IV secretory system conjugative DNA transfer family protein [Saliphagus sp. LR7]|uniref:type IV secretory system conjugative DNA transfer family protein n=1 Tax=Saliphagus sp. LR7 TaxID=2282654 RepID=UPI000DF7E817|nr:type IV secretory system conjugative DNA transfer family protein [Saliphagus sp. LR7]